MLTTYKNTCIEVSNIKRESAIVENVLNYLAENGIPIQCPDVNGGIWFEIDTPNDLEIAEKLILKHPTSFL